jgi:hypothetical protein
LRDRLIFILVVIAFVAAVPIVYYLLFEHGLSVSGSDEDIPEVPERLVIDPVEPQPVVDPVLPSALSLTETQGKVEIGREGTGWKTAEVGTVLSARDRIRTDPTARAVLSKPGVFSVELDAGSEFEVKSLAEDVSKFLLEEGMLSADVVENPDKVFEVNAAESVARTRGGSFKMSLDRQGLVALGTAKGEVQVQAAGKVIQVREGFVTRIAKGKPPQDPIKVPSNLFLRVRWPKKKELSRRKLVLAGRTAPGARVRVEGAIVQVDSKGKFRHVVALKEGVNKLKIDAYDVGGNQNTLNSPSMKVDTKPDAFHIRTSPEMWKNKKPSPP